MIKTVVGVRNVVQLFGSNPEHFSWVVSSGVLDGFDEININMGCPAPKITKEGSGCTLMRNLALAKKIITATAKAIKQRNAIRGKCRAKHFAGDCSQQKNCANPSNPLTTQAPTPPQAPANLSTPTIPTPPQAPANPQSLSVKMRLGWNKNIAVHFAKLCEECGADRIILHGRFGTDGYSGVADWNAIAEVVNAVKIPVIANGDVKDGDSVKKCLETTRAAGVMIGRGLLGYPWRVKINGETPPAEKRQIGVGDRSNGVGNGQIVTNGGAGSNEVVKNTYETGETPPAEDIKKIIARHIDLFTADKQPFPEFKKHALYYCNSLRVGKEIKRLVAVAPDMPEIKRLLGIDK
jgi:tRNA-dihydrouridine synthase